MPIIARINTLHSPLLVGAQGYDADQREWVHADRATVFADEADAIECIKRDSLVDVGIWTDPLLESFPSDPFSE